ncbi:MAG TPA: BREX system ATP-binding domain-containing protein [Armatimonadota bacterium]|jgi:hypothetical protein
MGVALADWVSLLNQEYLADFVASGGASVKIAVAAPATIPAAIRAVGDAAAAANYVTVSVDARRAKVYMIHQVFHEAALQVDWDALTERWVRTRLPAAGIRLPEGVPLDAAEAIAEANEMSGGEFLASAKRIIRNGIIHDYSMCKEFRIAMASLCTASVDPQDVAPTDADVVRQWLRGEKPNLAALKRLEIYQRIGRHNARLLLGSLAVWLARTGYAGLTLLADISAVVADAPEEGQPIRYTRATILDTYEVIRQFIDDTDELSHIMTVFFAGPGFADSPKRGISNYSALRMRVADDVRDRDRANPLNAMVRLDAAPSLEEAHAA